MRPTHRGRTLATRPLLTEDQATPLLATVAPVFVDGHLRAWRQWQELEKVCLAAGRAELLLPLSSTTRANFVNNHCIAAVVDGLEPHLDPDHVRLYDGLGFTTVIVSGDGGSALVRLKLLDGDLRTRNVTTDQQDALDRQEWDEDLLADLGRGLRPPTVVTCGYQLTDSQDEIKGIWIVCRQNGALYWSYPLYGEGSGAVLDVPLPGAPPRYSRVVSKQTESEASQARESNEL